MGFRLWGRTESDTTEATQQQQQQQNNPEASRASLVAQMVKNPPVMWETWVPWRRERLPHSNILAWRIPWTEEPDWLQSTGSQRVGHD